MVKREELIKIALYFTLIGIIGDVISTYLVLASSNPDLRESSPFIGNLFETFGLQKGLFFAIIINVFITWCLYFLYQKNIDSGIILWGLSFLRIYIVIGNFLLYFGLFLLPISRVDDLIVLGISMVLFNLFQRNEKA